jgi:ABC-2 type transport system permease protein
LGKLTAIMGKEIKELIRDPKILFGVILLPLILYPAMGSAINVSQQSVIDAIKGAKFAVYSDSSGPITDVFFGYISKDNTSVTIKANSLSDALNQFQASEAKSLIYVPAKYESNLTSGLRGNVKIYANLKGLNMAETQSTGVVGNLVNLYNYYYSVAMIDNLIKAAGQNGDAFMIHDPLQVKYASIIKGNVVEVNPNQITSLVMTQSIMLPMMIMVMVMFAIQMAATSMALEKEQKTLETLMTLPVDRMTILAGKLGGSIVIAVVGAISYMIGFSYYMESAFSFVPEMTSISLGDAGIGIQPLGYVIIGVVIFITLVSALALAISLAVFTDSVRSAQSITGVLIVPVVLPAMVLMFTDIELLPQTVQWIMLAIPYTHSMLATKAAFLGDYWIGIRSIIYISAFTLVTLFVAAKIFNTERVITGRMTNFTFRKKKQHIDE